MTDKLTVEDARAAVIGLKHVIVMEMFRTGAAHRVRMVALDADFNTALTALEDAVRREAVAAMPCYAGECREELIARYGGDGELGDGVGEYVCPSCQAREAHEEAAGPV